MPIPKRSATTRQAKDLAFPTAPKAPYLRSRQFQTFPNLIATALALAWVVLVFVPLALMVVAMFVAILIGALRL